MKLTKTIAAAAVVLTATAAQAEIQMIEGVVSFDKGTYQLKTAESKQTLTGLSMNELRAYEGLSVIISGEMTDNGKLEVYKVQQSVEGQLVTSYDWELVNNELYEN